MARTDIVAKPGSKRKVCLAVLDHTRILAVTEDDMQRAKVE